MTEREGAGTSKAHRGQKDYLCVELVQHTRTLQLIDPEIERLQIREVADRRRDGACARARELLCMSGSTQHAPCNLLRMR